MGRTLFALIGNVWVELCILATFVVFTFYRFERKLRTLERRVEVHSRRFADVSLMNLREGARLKDGEDPSSQPLNVEDSSTLSTEGVLRLELNADLGWTIADFGQLFNGLDVTYRLAVASIGTIGSPKIPDDELLHRLSHDSLIVRSLHMASPGWIEVIGSINPLKVIAQFITDYRKENTRRLKMEVDMAKVKANFVLTALNMLPPSTRSSDVVQQTVEQLFNSAATGLGPALDGRRIERAELLSGRSK